MTHPNDVKKMPMDGIIIKVADENVSIYERKQFIKLLSEIANRIKEQNEDAAKSR